MNRLFFLLALLPVALPGVDLLAQSATVESLSYLNFTSRYSIARGVSPDGQTVTGLSRAPGYATNSRYHAFRWTPTDGIQNLGAIDSVSNGIYAEGRAISANGLIVGTSNINTAGETRAFRLASFGGMQALPYLGSYSEATDVSDDGSVIVGDSFSSRYYAVRWTGAGNQTIESFRTIGDVVGSAVATACSADGSAIVGYSSTGAVSHACLFRTGQPAFDLGSLIGPAGSSGCLGISANGVHVVGYSSDPSGYSHAMYWMQSRGMVDLGTVDGVPGYSQANAVSANGRLIVGYSFNNSRPGGGAAVWIDGAPRQLWDLLVTDYHADMGSWTTLDLVYDVSRDGSVLVGYGTFEGVTTGFRVTLRQNNPPTIVPPTPVSVECTGGVNTVVLSAKVNDADSTDRLTVTWGVDGAIRQTNSNLVPGSNVTFSYKYEDGQTPVWMQVSDSKAAMEATTKVTVVDTKSPIVVVSADVHVKVDRGKIFASGVKLKRPFVSDVCDPAPKVTNNAKAKYPIGTTKVTWTVRDEDGNVAKAVQRVIVKNDPPVANAGANVTQTTTAPSVKVRLNGSLSRDPNGQKLTYLWKAPGAKLTGATTARPVGVFRVGTTRVTLTVTDEAGARSTDLMTVNIRAAQTVRTAATLADASMRESQLNALDSYQRGRGDSLSAEGLSLAGSAFALGAMAGDDVGANENASVSPEELTSYLTLRAQAAQQARMAGDRFYESFLAGGDGNALAASMYAYYGSGLNAADLASSDVHEALVDPPGEVDFAFEP
jgi:probable HAF family extracellular repeat protein